MAILSRGKKATAHRWNAINKQREKERQVKESEKEKVSDKEHEKRTKMLKEAGILK